MCLVVGFALGLAIGFLLNEGLYPSNNERAVHVPNTSSCHTILLLKPALERVKRQFHHFSIPRYGYREKKS